MTDAPIYKTYDERDPISQEEIRRAFPAGQEPPPLLTAWADWMRTQPAGWLGDILLGCHRPYSYLDAELDFHLADVIKGANFGASFWFHDQVGGRPPIILQDDDGDVEVIPSFEAFLARLALGVYADDEEIADDGEAAWRAHWPAGADDPMAIDALGAWAASMSLPDNAGALEEDGRLCAMALEGRRRLGAWLLERTGAPSLASLINDGPDAPDFHAWRAAQEAARAPTPKEQAAHAALLQTMTSKTALIIWAGDSYRAVVGFNGSYMPPYSPAQDGQAIKPHLEALRDEAARRTPGLGLWHSAIVTHPRFGAALGATIGEMLDVRTADEKRLDQAAGQLSSAEEVANALATAAETDGVIVSPSYHSLYPKELAATHTPPSSELQKDQQRFPREERRIEPWLKTLLSR